MISHGVRLGLRASRPGVLGALRERLPPGARTARSTVVDRLYSYVAAGRDPDARVRRMHLLYIDAVRVARDRAIAPALEQLETDARHTVAALAPRRVFVHAGVVAWQGRAIVIPGASFTGKTTLVAELVRRGATYYSDEYAVLDARGRVHPFAKPLSVRGEGERTPGDLGGRAGARPLPVAAIVIAPFRAGARWRARERPRGEGALALLSQAVQARLDPARTLAAVRAAAADAVVLKGARGDAGEMAGALLARAAA